MDLYRRTNHTKSGAFTSAIHRRSARQFVFEGKDKDSITFGNAGVYFPDNAAAYLDQSGAAATFDAAADGTLEIVFVQTAKNSWGDMILQNNNSYPLGMIVSGSDLPGCDLQTHV